MQWAENEGLRDVHFQLRDLAVSLFEKSPAPLPPAVVERLHELRKNDENPYVRWRSAFALVAHGERSGELLAQLKTALEDEDVKEIAEGYIADFNIPGDTSKN